MVELFIALRPKQWIKNFFIFLPLIFAKKFFIYPDNLKVALAFLFFSLASSAVYLVNDVLDLKSDREHPTKRLRPIASGKVSIHSALLSAAFLSIFSIAASFQLDHGLCAVIAAYLALNLLYSRYLKHRVLVDVGCIAVFFLLRLAAGSVTADIDLSHWIIFMTGLLALFLGFNKRRQELQLSEGTAASQRKVLLQYDDYFIDQMVSVITASIVVVYMLYTVDEDTVRHFGTKHLVYTIPFVYYGIFRYLYLVHKAQIDGDPTQALLSDLRMRVNTALWIATCVAVIYFGF